MPPVPHSDQLHEQWVERIHRITNELYSVHHYRDLWRKLAEITSDANLPPSLFFDALGVWYAATQAVAVRRQLDRRRDVVSLWRLLDEMARHPEVMTRDRHVALWDGDDARHANANFDRFSGGADQIAVDRIRADQRVLEATGESVKRYVDEAIAHTALVATPTIPTYDDLNVAIDIVAELVKKYASLLEAVMLWQFEPVITDDWQAIFRTAWLPNH